MVHWLQSGALLQAVIKGFADLWETKNFIPLLARS